MLDETLESGAHDRRHAVSVGGSLATYAVGRATGSSTTARVGADLFRAQALSQVMTQAIKVTARRTRPDGTTLSFPSGHTLGDVRVCDGSAAALRLEGGRFPPMRSPAIVGTSRIEASAIILSDVAFGAVLGIVAGRSRDGRPGRCAIRGRTGRDDRRRRGLLHLGRTQITDEAARRARAGASGARGRAGGRSAGDIRHSGWLRPHAVRTGKATPARPAPPRRSTILQINDVYSTMPIDGAGGLARVATLKQRLAAAGRTPFLILAGDFLSSSVASTVFKGEQMIAALNAAGLDMATLGNHEFDFGVDVLLQRMAEAQMAVGVSNVIDIRDRQADRRRRAIRRAHLRLAEGRLHRLVPDDRHGIAATS